MKTTRLLVFALVAAAGCGEVAAAEDPEADGAAGTGSVAGTGGSAAGGTGGSAGVAGSTGTGGSGVDCAVAKIQVVLQLLDKTATPMTFLQGNVGRVTFIGQGATGNYSVNPAPREAQTLVGYLDFPLPRNVPWYVQVQLWNNDGIHDLVTPTPPVSPPTPGCGEVVQVEMPVLLDRGWTP